MNLPNRMAWRYLFAKKSTNAINLITLIASFGVAIGVAALILLLSVFNGFEDIFLGFFNNLNPDVKITAREGKTFTIPDSTLQALAGLDAVMVVSETLEETVGFEYGGRQNAGQIKGVDYAYRDINGMDSLVWEGEYNLDFPQSSAYGTVIGSQLAASLGIDVLNRMEPLRMYIPRLRTRGSVGIISGKAPFIVREVIPTGVVRSQESVENLAALLDLGLTRRVLGVDSSTVSALELRLWPAWQNEEGYAAIREVMGPDFKIRNRYEQENTFLKVVQLEKWVSFAIVSMMMILISFNLIGALWMIVLEKQKDIAILRSLGMQATTIRNIFLRVGVLICLLGLGAGFLIAGLLYWIQKTYGLIRIPGMILEAYPISLRWLDFPIVMLTVLFIGLIASILPARRAQRMEAIIIEE